jgi:hypothetical protein
MADGFTISLKGEKELIKKFESMEYNDIKKPIKKIVKDSGKILLQETRAEAPRKTGALRKNIKLKVEKNKKKSGRFGVRVWLPLREKLDIPANSKWYYPGIQEYAFRSYHRAAVITKKDAVLNNMTKGIASFIEREWNKK